MMDLWSKVATYMRLLGCQRGQGALTLSHLVGNSALPLFYQLN